MNTLGLYTRYLGISVRSQMQYPASFWMFSLGGLVTHASEFMAVWALFARFGSLKAWTLPEVCFFYGVVNVTFAIADAVARGFDQFPRMVQSGDFDRLLLRPRSTVMQVAGQEFTLMRVGRLAQGLVILLWAAAALPVAWTPDKIALVVAMILGGVCIFYGLWVLSATLSFWTIETLEIMNTVTYGGTETAQYPLPIYRPWFRRFFTFVVPLACINYLPASLILPRPEPLPAHPALLWASPFVGVLFLFLCFQVWKLGVRHYHSTGS